MNIEIAPKETEIKADWYNAVIYCQFLDIDGKTGWRLPTKKELNRIYNFNHDFASSYYWSSTDIGDDAWVQIFLNGRQFYKFKTDSCYVRAVRDIK
jgi:hypothetical protein